MDKIPKTQAEMTTHSPPRDKLVARIIWVSSATLTSVVFIYALPFRYAQLRSDPFDLGEGLRALGLTVQDFAIYGTALDVLVAAACIVIGWMLFLRKADDRMVYLFSLTLIMFPITILPVLTVFQDVGPAWALLTRILRASGFFIIGASLITFPDGDYVPDWTRWGLVVWFAYCAFIPIFPEIAPVTAYTDLRLTSNLLRAIPFFYIFGFVALAQGVRYRYHSNASQRQQTKWVVLGVLMSGVTTVALILPPLIWAPLRTSPTLFTLYLIAAIPITLGVFLMFPISITFAVLRYRLWDIDIIIRRTLQYAILTGILALIYYGGVIFLQAGVRAATGQVNSPIITVATTLVIAALFNPLRNRVQGFVDRRFYRRKYDAEKTLSNFAATTREVVEVEKLTDALLGVVVETMQPERAALWLAKPERHTAEGDDLDSKR